MILINLKKSNTNFENNKFKMTKDEIMDKVEEFKKIIEDYLKMTNPPNLECPNCHSHDLIRWGSYERGVTYIIDKKSNNVRSEVIKIKRVRCNKCGKTHALLPIGIIPYKQITTELMNSILLYIINNSLENAVEKFPFNYLYLKKILLDFKNLHFPLLSTLLQSRNLQYIIQSINESLDLQIQYIINYGCCFMQIKIGCLSI